MKKPVILSGRLSRQTRQWVARVLVPGVVAVLVATLGEAGGLAFKLGTGKARRGVARPGGSGAGLGGSDVPREPPGEPDRPR